MTYEEKMLLKYDKDIVNLARFNKVYGYDDEDLAQEFRMILLKCLPNFKEDKKVKFKTYFISACKHEIIRLRKKATQDLSLNSTIGEFSSEEFLDCVLDTSLEYDCEVRDLEHFLARVPYGEYARMYLIDKEKQYDIAKHFGVSPVWVNLKIKEVLEKIREEHYL